MSCKSLSGQTSRLQSPPQFCNEAGNAPDPTCQSDRVNPPLIVHGIPFASLLSHA